MRIVVVSDSHGKVHRLQQIRQRHWDADFFVHCGDVETAPEDAQGYVVVQGNNDRYYDYPGELVLKFGQIKALITHSHQYHHFQRVHELFLKAKRLNCQMVLFGHTHESLYTTIEGITLLNPGSLYYNRDGKPISYMVIDIDNTDLKVSLIPYEE
jgi:uncharacterized protein